MALYRLKAQLTSFESIQNQSQSQINKSEALQWIGIGCFFFVIMGFTIACEDESKENVQLKIMGLYNLILGVFTFSLSVIAFIFAFNISKTFLRKKLNKESELVRMMKRFYIILLVDGFILLIIFAECIFFTFKQFAQSEDPTKGMSNRVRIGSLLIGHFCEVLPTLLFLLLFVNKNFTKVKSINNSEFDPILNTSSYDEYD
ncbi:hypothetical protein M0812_05784 [Anaeramoeba flamelloides]|uniref:Transmembrane protein n=1 Tax=Anaeramoeba flamelloides TaxID=1746091 RepID=A0AAV8A7S8_9EUKA|nr:hypothetical protein M0812_05784 [Anaeramoeba flamelloides]